MRRANDPGHDRQPLRWTRRSILAQLASVPLASCVSPNGPFALSVAAPSLIDAHCHLFNITDLPAASFTQKVLLSNYEHAGQLTVAELALKDSLSAIEWILTRGVTTAAAEASEGPASFEAPAKRLSTASLQSLESEQRKAENALQQLSQNQMLVRCPSGGPSLSVRSIVTWLKSLRSTRANLAADLARAHAESGYRAALLCPALVDYSNWLNESLISPLPDQVRAAGAVAANPSLPAVHGYAPFDPLRQALFRERFSTVDGSWNPLQLVREALLQHGFLGVKLYPPMGFRASGNGGSGDAYPPHVEARFGSREAVAKALDVSLAELWALCTEVDAPVMAHAANSNADGLDYARRADPSYWFSVARDHPTLRILLAHFGRFRSVAAGFSPPQTCGDEVPFEHTWEGVIGGFVRANPSTMLFADLSYLSEIFDTAEEARAVQRMKQYLLLDPQANHIVFGSDWVMLGIEKEYPRAGGYPHRIASFLRQAGLDGSAINRVMFGNAVRFLGLEPGSGARARLLKFYSERGLPASRLPA